MDGWTDRRRLEIPFYELTLAEIHRLQIHVHGFLSAAGIKIQKQKGESSQTQSHTKRATLIQTKEATLDQFRLGYKSFIPA